MLMVNSMHVCRKVCQNIECTCCLKQFTILLPNESYTKQNEKLYKTFFKYNRIFEDNYKCHCIYNKILFSFYINGNSNEKGPYSQLIVLL